MPCWIIESRDDREMKSHRGAIAEVARQNRGAYKKAMHKVKLYTRRCSLLSIIPRQERKEQEKQP